VKTIKAFSLVQPKRATKKVKELSSFFFELNICLR